MYIKPCFCMAISDALGFLKIDLADFLHGILISEKYVHYLLTLALIKKTHDCCHFGRNEFSGKRFLRFSARKSPFNPWTILF